MVYTILNKAREMMMEKCKVWIKENILHFAIVWSLSFLLMWSLTKSLRLSIPLFLLSAIGACCFDKIREVFIVCGFSLISLGLVFTGLDVFLASAALLLIALCINGLILINILPKLYSASLYAPALAITLVLGQTL
jgi:hypothetical protein